MVQYALMAIDEQQSDGCPHRSNGGDVASVEQPYQVIGCWFCRPLLAVTLDELKNEGCSTVGFGPVAQGIQMGY